MTQSLPTIRAENFRRITPDNRELPESRKKCIVESGPESRGLVSTRHGRSQDRPLPVYPCHIWRIILEETKNYEQMWILPACMNPLITDRTIVWAEECSSTTVSVATAVAKHRRSPADVIMSRHV